MQEINLSTNSVTQRNDLADPSANGLVLLSQSECCTFTEIIDANIIDCGSITPNGGGDPEYISLDGKKFKYKTRFKNKKIVQSANMVYFLRN